MEYAGSFKYMIVLSGDRSSLTSFPFLTLLYFSCFIPLAKTFSTILDKIGEIEHTNQNSKENYRPIFLMDTDAKVLHTILVN